MTQILDGVFRLASPTPMQTNGGPITECPICRYSLEGLPRDHQCPECGFAYDHRMRVWRSGPPWIHRTGLIGGLVLTFATLAALVVRRTQFRWLEMMQPVGLMVWGMVLTFFSLQKMRYFTFIIVGANSILTRRHTSKIKAIPMSELHIARGTNRILIFRGDEPDPIDLPIVYSTSRHWRQTCEEVYEYIVECWEIATGKKAEHIAWDQDWYAENVIVVDKDGRIRRTRRGESPSE